MEHNFLSGMYPGFGTIIKIVLLFLLIYGIYQILKESNRKQKVIQLVILLIGILLGIIVAISTSNSSKDDSTRRYYTNEIP